MIKTDVYEPGSLTRARVRRIPAFLSVALTTYVILLYRFRFVNHFSRNFHDKRMNDCLPPILFSSIFKLLKVLPDTELDAC